MNGEAMSQTDFAAFIEDRIADVEMPDPQLMGSLNAVATALGLEISGASVKAEGDLDFRGTLGVAKEVPVGFRDIRLAFDINGKLDDDQKASLIKLTERYCVVYQTLRNPPPVAVDVRWG